MARIRLGIVGLGQIARSQHLGAIAAAPGFELVAAASRQGTLPGLPVFTSLGAMLAADVALDAVALCTPPQGRHALVAEALDAGMHVLLEKPPGASVSELGPLVAKAERSGRTLFTTWHSRFAPAVAPARAFLARNRPRSVEVVWKEDVRVWHPGQDWIFEPGGLGVFDPGINALSILTAILPEPIFVTGALLSVPANRQAPIAAELDLSDALGLPIHAEFDFRQTGEQSWDIRVETEAGPLFLSSGGRTLSHDGRILVDEPEQEYARIYRRFEALVAEGRSDVDLAPLVLVGDAFMLGRRLLVEPFQG
ncbi:putative dehydrogenase [Bosea sp. LC85]|uniref:Gfo/Idh/MocA family protein n=1 Tax=Bosea sp. LC85 TaxID=1502851 RepID=UPI0004E2DD48|nr:Gfo/Idh/MocA family oxidoreductase [Bosea sp. LC85]KFC75955.1 putative dehydrogenase [Bosea sp. LC85]